LVLIVDHAILIRIRAILMC